MARQTKRARLVEKFGLTDRDIREIQATAQGVWNDVGYDCLQGIAEMKRKPVEAVTVPRAVVIEIVLDADRLLDKFKEGHGPTRRYQADVSPTLQHFLTQWDTWTDPSVDWEEAKELMQILMRETFTYARWGM